MPLPNAALADKAGACQPRHRFVVPAWFSIPDKVLRAAMPMSSLLTTITCGTSMMPAFEKLNAVAGSRLGDEAGGVGHLGDVDFFLPDPTVSTSTMSKAASIARLIGQTSALRPPNLPRQASERMNTSRFRRRWRASQPIAQQRAAADRLDGSTARMATFKPRAAARPGSGRRSARIYLRPADR